MENRGGKATRSAKVPSGEPSEDESPTQPNPDLKKGEGGGLSPAAPPWGWGSVTRFSVVRVGVWQPREVWLHKGKPDANARLARIPTGPIGGVAGEKHKDLPRARDCKPSAHTHR